MADLPFDGLRVLELGSGIATAYCGKMLTDAGADVVKVEPVGGDPMRQWRAHPDTGAGALFDYLAAGKRSVLGDAGSAEVRSLLDAADVVVTDLCAGWTLSELTAGSNPAAVILTITPFGTTGPYVDARVQVNEFLLQALCGSIGGRGWPGSEPMQAGGRIGDWFAGAYAAVAVTAATRRALRNGAGETIDLSSYEAMVVAARTARPRASPPPNTAGNASRPRCSGSPALGAARCTAGRWCTERPLRCSKLPMPQPSSRSTRGIRC